VLGDPLQLARATAMAPTEEVPKVSSEMGVQVVPASVVFQTPLPTPPM
jgi:hypothetical protein